MDSVMRRALLLFLILPLALSASITRVGHAVHLETAQSDTVTVSYAPTSGNLVIVGCSAWINASTTPTTEAVDDGGHNSYSLAATKFQGTKVTTYLHYALNVTGGSFTYTCTVTGASFWLNIYVIEYSGVALTSATDSSSTSATNATGSPVTTAGQTTTASAEVIVGIWVVGDNNGTITSTPGNSFTAVDESLNCNASICGGSMERIVSSIGTYTAQTVRSPAGTESFSIVQAAFKAISLTTNARVSVAIQ